MIGPTRQALAKILTFGEPEAELIFNYERAISAAWKEPSLQQALGYRLVFPPAGQEGIEIEA